ncbi:MAG: hypothetical protein HY908_29810 [Myxococcales bacterium]|nr:hypothetical protein [Myxococcales bacterium]
MTRARRPLPVCVVALAASGCITRPAQPPRAPTSELHVYAEGPCPKLAPFALGDRRVVVYGDTGYDLHAWYAGEPLAAAQALVELRPDGAYRDPLLLAGLARDAGGYVNADLALGGALEAGSAWLLATTSRYARHGRGSLFERHAAGYAYEDGAWRPTAEPVALPAGARALPELAASDACGHDLSFIATAWAASPDGDLLVAGRCDDEAVTNHPATVVVAHADAGARAWRYERVPGTAGLDGILNLDLAVVSAREAYLVAHEPFVARERRHAFLVRWDGVTWGELDLGIHDGMMAVAHESPDTLWVAGGRALYRQRGARPAEVVPLPALRYAEVPPAELHVHDVRAFAEGDVWVSASYRVARRLPGVDHPISVWASALYHSLPPPRPLYCDASLPADEALFEVE